MQLSNVYRMFIICQDTDDISKILGACLHFLQTLALDPKTANRLSATEKKINSIPRLQGSDKKKHLFKKILFDDVFSLLDDIAPEGCHFGRHPSDNALIGFWDNHLPKIQNNFVRRQ